MDTVTTREGCVTGRIDLITTLKQESFASDLEVDIVCDVGMIPRADEGEWSAGGQVKLVGYN